MQPSSTLTTFRILVVEDSRDAADSLGLLFGLWGHEAVVVYDGPGALAAAAAHSPDVIFLDIGLPGMDGYEVARQLRQQPPLARALLVAITGYGRDDEVRCCKEAGIDYHFLKPVDPAELKQLLARAEKLRGD